MLQIWTPWKGLDYGDKKTHFDEPTPNPNPDRAVVIDDLANSISIKYLAQPVRGHECRDDPAGVHRCIFGHIVKSLGENKVIGRGVDGRSDEEKDGSSYPRSKIIGVSRGPNFKGEPDYVAGLISQKVDENWNYLPVVKVAPTPKGIVYLALYRLQSSDKSWASS